MSMCQSIMEMWSAYKCQDLHDSVSFSGATHFQAGSIQASKKDVSVKASDQSASAETQEQEVSYGICGRSLSY